MPTAGRFQLAGCLALKMQVTSVMGSRYYN